MTIKEIDTQLVVLSVLLDEAKAGRNKEFQINRLKSEIDKLLDKRLTLTK